MKNYVKYSNIFLSLIWIVAHLLTASYYSKSMHYEWSERVDIFSMINNLLFIDSTGLKSEFGISFFIFLLIFIINIIFTFSSIFKYYFQFVLLQFVLFILYAKLKVLFLFYAGFFSIYGLFTADGEWFAEGWPNLHVLGLFIINMSVIIMLYLNKNWLTRV